MIRKSLALALALTAAGCTTAWSGPPDEGGRDRDDREFAPSPPDRDWGPSPLGDESPRSMRAPAEPLRDDVPESVRREWFAKNGPAAYVPAREAADAPGVIVRERRVYVDRDDCGYRTWPVHLSLGYAGFHGGGRRWRGWGYGVGLGSGFGCW